jgi:hypothetical protein
MEHKLRHRRHAPGYVRENFCGTVEAFIVGTATPK